ncbi:MAG: flagellar biosynthesis protein FlhA [Myxococcota bacterium]|nr:flagellar biosynthesis protein FlhA [Myxococcota bacterium]
MSDVSTSIGAVSTTSSPIRKTAGAKSVSPQGEKAAGRLLPNLTKGQGGRADSITGVMLMTIVALLILPVPPFVLDLLLAVSICVGVTVLMTAVYIEKPVEFSSFPTVLLMVTLFRLTLNVASTRLILLNGHTGTDAVGSIIKAFGSFVAGGDIIVGIVIFLILVLINFIVITKGSGRIAEVAARFNLDAMPGKQMSIDADLNAGVIGEAEAKQRRRQVEKEADFYGAMDGASKFVRGDAIAGLVVTAINLIGGLLIGTIKHGVDIGTAASTYSILTIGDGLVSQLPALIVSTAAGVVVSRAAGEGRLGQEVGQQVLLNPKPLYMTSGLVGVLGLLPGLPAVPLFALATGMAWLGTQAQKTRAEAEAEEIDAASPTIPSSKSEEDTPVEDLLYVETLELEVGYALVNIVDSDKPNSLMKRINGIRRQLAQTLGIILPPVRVKDNLQLESTEYVLYLRTVPIARGKIEPEKFLAIDPGTAFEEIEGIKTTEPAFGLDAVWIDESERDNAEALGYTTVDGSTVIATHLGEELRRNAHDLLGRQEVQDILDALSKTHAKFVNEIVPKQVSHGDLLRVLRALLEEQVPVRDLRTILETLADILPDVKGTEELADAVRQRLAAALTHKLAEGSKELHAFFLDPALEQALRTAFVGGSVQAANLDGDALRTILSKFENSAAEAANAGHTPVVIVSPDLRRQIRDLVCRFLPNLAVLSHREVDGNIEIRSLGRIGL